MIFINTLYTFLLFGGIVLLLSFAEQLRKISLATLKNKTGLISGLFLVVTGMAIIVFIKYLN